MPLDTYADLSQTDLDAVAGETERAECITRYGLTRAYT